MRPTLSLVGILTVLSLTLGVGIAGRPIGRASAQPTDVNVVVFSYVANQPDDPDFPAEYNYFLTSMPRINPDSADITASAAGSETYQIYDDADGSIVATQTVSDGGSTEFTISAGIVYHVINIDDPGTGTPLIASGNNPTVTVVINPGAGSGPTSPPLPTPTLTSPESSNAATAPPTVPATNSATTATAAPTTITAATQPAARTDGRTAAIFAGDCDSDFAVNPVAELSDVTGSSGDAQGADSTAPVQTSFSTLNLSLDDLLADDHVLAVFGQDDDTVPLACGAIGGVVADDGSLAFGLPTVGDSRYAGIAYLAPDGARQTQVTIFLAKGLSEADATPTA